MIVPSLEEQELTINVYPRQIDSRADVFSSIPYWTKRLQKLASARPDAVSVRETGDGVFASVPLEWIKVSPPRQVNLTDEQRQARSEFLRMKQREKREAQDE